MSTDSLTIPPQKEETTLKKVASLGTSALGESVALRRSQIDSADLASSDAPHGDESSPQFVMKKITKARLKSPENFRQNFEALRRLDHPNLCPYRDLYIGERTIRITRDYIDGLPLDEYLLQPITDEESAELKQHTESIDESSSELDAKPQEEAPKARATPSSEDEPISAPVDLSAAEESDEAPLQDCSSSPDSATEENEESAPDDRPTTLEIPASLLEDSEAADRALDLIILRLRRVLPGIISALEYLHRFRRVHASLKPSNILITNTDQVILTDYDLYPAFQLPTSHPRPLDFRAPETYDGQYSPSSDLYSLGAILFYALAESPYGELCSPIEEDMLPGESRPLYLTEIVPHCPASWSDLIHGLLDSDPDKRPTIDEVYRQIASSEQRSVNIRATIVQERDSLYGRRDTLATLTEHATACSQNRRLALALIQGRIGVGKTALVDALARQASQRGWIVLHGRCYRDEPVAYQGWEEIADQLTAIADELPEKQQRRLARCRSRAALLFPQLASSDEPPPKADAQAAIAGLRAFIDGIAQQRPMLICLDDLHWAGEDSIQLLAELATAPDQLRVMIVGTMHTNGDLPGAALLKEELKTAPIDPLILSLEGFTKAEAREYVLAHTAHLTLPQKQQILRQGGFNPLLIDELIHEFSGAYDDTLPGTDADEARPPEFDEASPDQSADVLDRHLCHLIEQRFTELSRSERLALQLLAVASSPLSAKLLDQALSEKIGTQTADLRSGEEIIESLVEKRLVRQARQLTHSQDRSPRFTVIHDMCRQVIQEEIGQDHHSRLCGIIADALSDQDDPSQDLRFEYLRRAVRHDEAVHAAAHAAQSALQRFAYHRAAHLLRWLAKQSPLSLEQRANFARALVATSEFAEAQEIIAEILEEVPPSDQLELRFLQLQALLSSGNRKQTIATLDASLHALDKTYLHRSALTRFGAHKKRWASALGRAANITTIAQESAPPAPILASAELLRFGIDAGPLLHSASSPYLIHHYGGLAHRHRFGPLLARDRLHTIGLPWLPFLSRPSKHLERHLEQAHSLFESQNDLLGRAACAELRAHLASHGGDLPQAQKYAQQALDLLNQSGRSDKLLQTRLNCFLIHCALVSGETQKARNQLASLRHQVRRHRHLQVLVNFVACDLELLTGDLEATQASLDLINEFIGDDKNCLIHLAMMERRTRQNIALGRPEVSIAQWDLLLSQIYERPLRRVPAAQLIIARSMATALTALLQRKLSLQEPRRRTIWRRLGKTLRRLSDLEPWMGAQDRAHLQRLRARVELLRRRPHKALKYARRAQESALHHSSIIISAMNKETLGIILDRLDEPEGRATLDQSYQIYEQQGVFLPLVLEGWPVPSAHSLLQEDP